MQPYSLSRGPQRHGLVASRQTNGNESAVGRSDIGKSSIGDTSSMVFKNKLIEFKGPQLSDMMPIFRLQKAQPIPKGHSVPRMRSHSKERASSDERQSPP